MVSYLMVSFQLATRLGTTILTSPPHTHNLGRPFLADKFFNSFFDQIPEQKVFKLTDRFEFIQ